MKEEGSTETPKKKKKRKSVGADVGEGAGEEEEATNGVGAATPSSKKKKKRKSMGGDVGDEGGMEAGEGSVSFFLFFGGNLWVSLHIFDGVCSVIFCLTVPGR